MSVICVPPGSTSPYQNGAGAAVNVDSSKFNCRHAVVSGVEASVRPLNHFQFGAFVLNRSAADATIWNPNTSAKAKTNLFAIFRNPLRQKRKTSRLRTARSQNWFLRTHG